MKHLATSRSQHSDMPILPAIPPTSARHPWMEDLAFPAEPAAARTAHEVRVPGHVRQLALTRRSLRRVCRILRSIQAFWEARLRDGLLLLTPVLSLFS